MCNTTIHRPTAAAFNGIVDPFSFSTFHLLRTCNRLMLPTDIRSYYSLMKDTNNNVSNKLTENDREQISDTIKSPINTFKNLEIPFSTPTQPTPNTDYNTIFPAICPRVISPSSRVSSSPHSYEYHTPTSTTEYPANNLLAYNSPNNNRLITTEFSYPSMLSRRQRGEKRPIPNEQKDEKYYERRKRNNEAAKKSRDARKLREDRIAFRAALLEQENAILRAQMVAMRDEMNTLRQMISNAAGSNGVTIPTGRTAPQVP